MVRWIVRFLVGLVSSWPAVRAVPRFGFRPGSVGSWSRGPSGFLVGASGFRPRWGQSCATLAFWARFGSLAVLSSGWWFLVAWASSVSVRSVFVRFGPYHIRAPIDGKSIMLPAWGGVVAVAPPAALPPCDCPKVRGRFGLDFANGSWSMAQNMPYLPIIWLSEGFLAQRRLTYHLDTKTQHRAF